MAHAADIHALQQILQQSQDSVAELQAAEETRSHQLAEVEEQRHVLQERLSSQQATMASTDAMLAAAQEELSCSAAQTAVREEHAVHQAEQLAAMQADIRGRGDQVRGGVGGPNT